MCIVRAFPQTVKDSRVVYGGGHMEILMAKAVDELAQQTPGKKALAMEVRIVDTAKMSDQHICTS